MIRIIADDDEMNSTKTFRRSSLLLYCYAWYQIPNATEDRASKIQSLQSLSYFCPELMIAYFFNAASYKLTRIPTIELICRP